MENNLKPYPEANQFVGELRKIAPTVILTSGGKEHQLRAIQACGLPFSPQQVFGKAEYGQIPQLPKSILIDDLGENTAGVVDKLKAIGVGKDRFVQRGRDQNLLTLLPAVKSLLGNPIEKVAQRQYRSSSSHHKLNEAGSQSIRRASESHQSSPVL